MQNVFTTTNAVMHPANDPMQIKQFDATKIAEFMKWAQVTSTTTNTYLKAIRHFIVWLTAHNITNPTKDDALNYANELRESLKPTTQQSYVNACRQFFKYLCQFGYYPNIFQYVKNAKIDFEHHKKDALSLEQVGALLGQYATMDANIKNARDYALMLLLCSCGLRTIEIERANICDLVNNGSNAYMFVQGKGRTEKAEKIEIPTAVYNAIHKYLAMRTDATASAPLFISVSNHDYGVAMTKNSVSRVVKTALRNIGIDNPRITAHSCRHFAITQALKNGNDIRYAQQMARHKNLNTTLIYAHDLERANNHCETSVCNSIMEQLGK